MIIITWIILSILYWFYFLHTCVRLPIKQSSTFNPILVLFSHWWIYRKLFSACLSILYWFYFLFWLTSLTFWLTLFFQSYIGSIFSRYGNSAITCNDTLSILYWFYFLAGVTIVALFKGIDFQSYIGSIFSWGGMKNAGWK